MFSIDKGKGCPGFSILVSLTVLISLKIEEYLFPLKKQNMINPQSILKFALKVNMARSDN